MLKGLSSTALRTTQRLFLLRHGQTEFNKLNIVQGGGVDSDLNDTGRQQAERFHAHYGHLPFVSAYCSTLKRTRQTLHHFEHNGLVPTQIDGLKEMGWGVLEGVQQTAESEHLFKQMLDRWANGELTAALDGGETPLEVRDRAVEAVRCIVETQPEGDLLICTHGRTLRILLAELLGYGLERMQWFGHANTGLNVLVRAGEAIYLEKYNDISHLQALPR